MLVYGRASRFSFPFLSREFLDDERYFPWSEMYNLEVACFSLQRKLNKTLHSCQFCTIRIKGSREEAKCNPFEYSLVKFQNYCMVIKTEGFIFTIVDVH